MSLHKANPRKSNPNKKTKTQRVLKRVGKELKKNEPAIVAKTRRKKGAGAAKKQKTAILLSKARRAGAKIPKRTV